MLASSVVNGITFKRIGGTYPTRFNTLQRNRAIGGMRVIDYQQKFNVDEAIQAQFVSDIADDLTVDLCDIFGNVISSVNVVYAQSYAGVDARYFFNYELSILPIDADNVFQIKAYQADGDPDYSLISEPVTAYDLTEDIAAGRIMRIEYSNIDRISDIDDFYVDWSIINSMFFYVEAVNFQPVTKNETEVLQGVQSETILSALIYSGNELKTGPIPDYLSLKLIAAASLDIFIVNGRQMVKGEEASEDAFGQSTLLQTTLTLTDKNVIGLNLDDLGITISQSEDMAIISVNNSAVTTAGLTVEMPAGYMLHTISMSHSDTSAPASSTVKLGTTAGASDLIDEIQGELIRADYNRSANRWKIFPKHYLKNPDVASNLYFTVTGGGSVLSIFINFERIIE